MAEMSDGVIDATKGSGSELDPDVAHDDAARF